MAVDLTPAKWFDEDAGATNTVVTEGAGKAGYIKIYGWDADGGIPGLDLQNGTGDSDSASRILRSILNFMHTYQEGLASADKPTGMVITRSSYTNSGNVYVSYNVAFKLDMETAEPVTEP